MRKLCQGAGLSRWEAELSRGISQSWLTKAIVGQRDAPRAGWLRCGVVASVDHISLRHILELYLCAEAVHAHTLQEILDNAGMYNEKVGPVGLGRDPFGQHFTLRRKQGEPTPFQPHAPVKFPVKVSLSSR